MLEAIFATIGVSDRYFVEIGCQDGTECNTAYLAEQGWHGLLMDGGGSNGNARAVIQPEFVTAENINGLLIKYDVPSEFDLLSIDIDGNDYWVWKAIVQRPRVVVIEYNAHVAAQERRAIVYDPHFAWQGTDYFGASLRALKELGEDKGYTLVYCERTGTNAFFVRDDQLPESYTAPPLEATYRAPNYFGQGRRWPRDGRRHMVDPLALPSAKSGLKRFGKVLRDAARSLVRYHV